MKGTIFFCWSLRCSTPKLFLGFALFERMRKLVRFDIQIFDQGCQTLEWPRCILQTLLPQECRGTAIAAVAGCDAKPNDPQSSLQNLKSISRAFMIGLGIRPQSD